MYEAMPMPTNLTPIYMIGAGGIVRDAHLPAYKLAGFQVLGIYDVDVSKAKMLADIFDIPKVFEHLADMLQEVPKKVVFDLAVPGSAIAAVLEKLPIGAAVLMQKPMGNNLKEATRILEITKERQLLAGVNFQLRYAPFINAAREMIDRRQLGILCGIDIHVDVFTPWQLWKFLYGLPRVEILYHSIHYIDLIRSFLGNPVSVFSKTVKHPAMMELASVKSNIIMDYGDAISANIITDHTHIYGPDKEEATITFKGTIGAIKIKLGLLMNYPQGVADKFEYIILQDGEERKWKSVNIEGGWFPHAFIGSMAQMMLAIETGHQPDNSVVDALDTMACVEAAYMADSQGGVKL